MALLAPKDARTFAQRCKLEMEACHLKKSYFLLTHAGLVISNHVSGEKSTGTVALTRREFERFVRFYTTGQRILTAKTKAIRRKGAKSQP